MPSSTKASASPPASPSRGLSAKARLYLIVAGAVVLLAAFPIVRCQIERSSLRAQIERGLAVLDGAASGTSRRLALDIWEHETRDNWQDRVPDLVDTLIGAYSIEDTRVQRLLTRVTGAAYGNRLSDWARWRDARRAIRAGEEFSVPRAQRVKLEPRWVAPVGLTMWFSTIIPRDGQVYVASLGTRFDETPDAADGVVRVDGATGEATIAFAPPPRHRGPRDIIGLAGVPEGLYVACYNGSVYLTDENGEVQWDAHAGSPIVAAPLAVDTNMDGTTDVVVVTRAGKVVAFSGHRGTTTWVADIVDPPPDETLLGAAIATGLSLHGETRELVVTLPTGEVAIVAVRNGQIVSRIELSAGTLAGPTVYGRAVDGTDALALADSGGGIWTLSPRGGGIDQQLVHALAVRGDESIVGAIRTRSVPNAAEVEIIAAITGETDRGAICAISSDAIRWRCAIGGTIWGTPALADLNGDGLSEAVIGSEVIREDGSIGGALTVVSGRGHIVWRQAFAAAIESSPMISDVDGDGMLEVLVADRSGRLHCFGSSSGGPVEWGLFGGDSHNTRSAVNAYSFGQVPFGYQSTWQP